MPSSSASPSRRVAVTAVGGGSPLGVGGGGTPQGLRAAHAGGLPVTGFDVTKTRCKTAGLVDLAKLRGGLGAEMKRRSQQLHPASLMMMAAAAEVRQGDAAFAPELLVVGTTSGGMSFGEAFYRA